MLRVPSDIEDDISPRSPLLPRNEPSLLERGSHSFCKHNARVVWVVHAALLTVSLLLLVAAYMLTSQPPSIATCVESTSSWSPARSAVAYHSVQFDANITDSSYVGPTKAVDLHWGRVNFGDQMILPSEMALLKKPLDSLQVTDPRTGQLGYRIGLEVFHQLHCLNMIRKATYAHYQDDYSNGDFGVPQQELRGHLDHCIEMLRMNLMCHADIGVITFHELEGKGMWPDFSSWHTCRDYDALRDWAVDRVVATDPV